MIYPFLSRTLNSKQWSDFIALSTLISCGFIFTYHVSLITDIGLYDESNYLLWGFNFSKSVPPPESGSGYALWYYLLSFVSPDRIKAYYLNAKLLTLLLPICIYLTLRSLKSPIIPSLIISVLFLISAANFPMTPKVSQFGALIMLAGIVASLSFNSTVIKICLLTIISLFVSYTRPEFYISWLIFIAFLSFFLITKFKKEFIFNTTIPILITFILSFLIITSLGRPMGDGSRSILAFGQHYAANWVTWNASSLNPWTNWDKIFNVDFKYSTSVMGAAFTNPTAFFQHILFNLSLLPANLNRLLSLIYLESIFKLISVQFKIIWISTLVFYSIILVKFLFKNKFYKKEFFKIIKSSLPDVLLLLVLLVPSSISVIIIGPRDHYLLFVELLFILMTFILLINPIFSSFNSVHKNAKSLVPLTMLCIICLFLVRPMIDYLKPQPLDNLNTIKFLQSLNISNKVNMLEAEGGYDIYLNNNFSRIPEYAKGEPFNQFHNKNTINAIVSSSALRNDSRFKSDPEWISFIANHEIHGYSVLDIPNVPDRKLYIRKELLN